VGALSQTTRRPPPAVPGDPLLGNLRAYRSDHLSVFRAGYEAHGPVFSIRLAFQRAVVLIGPEYHRWFFREVDRTLSVPELYEFVVPMFGRVLNAVEDQQIRRRQLALLHTAFKGERMSAHVGVMADETAAWLDALGDDGSFELYDGFSKLAMNIAASAFVGPEVRARMSEFAPLFADLARGMDFVLPPNLPLPRFIRRDRARAALTAMIAPAIAAREREPGGRDDLLQAVLDLRRDEATGLDDEATVAGFTLATLFTGYLTTAAQACWVVIQLLQHPRYLARVRAEIASQLPGSPSTLDRSDLGRLEVLERAIKESQRMHPVMSHYARYNRRAYTIDGFDVPAGWMTMLCPAVAHRLREVFEEPDAYDPDRFAPGRDPEAHHPYALIGFSAGVYRCPGAGFGINEIKCIVAQLLARYELELEQQRPRPSFDMGVIRPAPPCRVRYARRRITADPPVAAKGVPHGR
jgi:sterol 14-demethylase